MLRCIHICIQCSEFVHKQSHFFPLALHLAPLPSPVGPLAPLGQRPQEVWRHHQRLAPTAWVDMRFASAAIEGQRLEQAHAAHFVRGGAGRDGRALPLPASLAVILLLCVLV
jgi:hypothetical protein